jgi:hypothetical protein
LLLVLLLLTPRCDGGGVVPVPVRGRTAVGTNGVPRRGDGNVTSEGGNGDIDVVDVVDDRDGVNDGDGITDDDDETMTWPEDAVIVLPCDDEVMEDDILDEDGDDKSLLLVLLLLLLGVITKDDDTLLPDGDISNIFNGGICCGGNAGIANGLATDDIAGDVAAAAAAAAANSCKLYGKPVE